MPINSAGRLPLERFRRVADVKPNNNRHLIRQVPKSHVQVQTRGKRIEVSKPGIFGAEWSYDLNLQRNRERQPAANRSTQSVLTLAKAQRDYLNAVIDHNVSQVRLCRATVG